MKWFLIKKCLLAFMRIKHTVMDTLRSLEENVFPML